MDRMDDVIRQARVALRGMWQWRWIGLASAWLIAAVAAVVIYRMPDQYEASARIYVDTESVLKPLMSGLAVQPNVEQRILILSRTLISRPNLEKLIRMADLDHSVNSQPARDSLVEGLMRNLEIKSAGRDNLYTLAYRTTQPATALRIVQSLTSMFVESSLGNKRQDADSAKQFIEDQIKIYEAKLAEAENRLKDFKLRNLSLNMSDGRDAFSRMGELASALNQARLELREAEHSRDALKRQIVNEEAAPVLLGEPQSAGTPAELSMPELDKRIDAMKRNLDVLLQRYTEQHPDVTGARRVIKELEEQKREELAALKKALRSKSKSSGSTASVAPNPVHQQLRVSLAEAEGNVASLQTRVAEYEARYNRAKASIQMMPDLEAEFAQLNRDYEVHKRNYESLVSRRESVSISSQMEATAGLADFRLIDPPRVSPEPVAPNRLLLFSLALVGSLVAGVLSSFAATQIRPSFLDAHSVREVTGLPVLGTVSLIASEPLKRRERRGLIAFIGGIVALIGSYGAGILVLLLLSTRTV